MLARVTTFTLDGLDPRPVVVEADLRSGLPAFTVVGLGDRSVAESRERVKAAILNSGFQFPQRRITVNLAPAYLRKTGAGFDLAIACAILAAEGAIAPAALERLAVFGELSLSGEVRACPGTLVAAEGARRLGLGRARGAARARRRGGARGRARGAAASRTWPGSRRRCAARRRRLRFAARRGAIAFRRPTSATSAATPPRSRR